MYQNKASLFALEQFDDLPDSAFVRQPVVLGLFSCSKATLWRWVKQSKLPQPHKLGERISAWNVGQLRQTISSMNTVNVKGNGHA